MGEYQIWVIVVVVVLSILDAMMKKARKRGAGLPPEEEDDPLGMPGGEQERPSRRAPGPVGAPERIPPGPVATSDGHESAGPLGRRTTPTTPSRPRPQPQPQPTTAGQAPAGKRPSAFDILVPPEMRKELEDILSGGGQRAGQGTSSPTASGPTGPTDAPGTRNAPSAPLPDSSPQEPGDSWGGVPLPERSRAPRPVEVRSRAPRPVAAHSREPRMERGSAPVSAPLPGGPASPSERYPTATGSGADSTPSAGRRPSDPTRLGFGTIDGLRRMVVAREVLGPPVAMRDEKEFGAVR